MADTNVPQDVYNFTNATSLGSSPTIFNYAGVDITFARAVRFLRASGAGNIVYKDASNTNKTAAFLAGETRALIALGIVAAGTTATGIEGMV